MHDSNESKAFQLSDPIKSVEWNVSDIQSATLKKGWFWSKLKVHLAGGKKQNCRIQNAEQIIAIKSLLPQALGERFIM